LIYTLPSLWNVAMLLLIVLFIYAVLGMAFFGDQPMGTGPYGLYNDHANFRTFWKGFITLFRMSTGESWNGIMHDSMDQVSQAAWVYYVSYMVIAAYLLFQLIVAVVLEQFTGMMAEEDSIVSPDDIENFSVAWRELDPNYTEYISLAQLPMLLGGPNAVDPPLGLGPDAGGKDMMTLFNKLNLNVHGETGRANYVEVFFALVLNAYKEKHGHRWSGNLPDGVLLEMTEKLKAGFQSVGEIADETAKPALENYAALKIQKIARGRFGKKKWNQIAGCKFGQVVSEAMQAAKDAKVQTPAQDGEPEASTTPTVVHTNVADDMEKKTGEEEADRAESESPGSSPLSLPTLPLSVSETNTDPDATSPPPMPGSSGQ